MMIKHNVPRLYYTPLTNTGISFDDISHLLSKERYKIAIRRPAQDRLPSAAAELLLRYALGECGYDPHIPVLWEGKPRFADGGVPLRFNLSHSRGAVAVLLSLDGTSVGVDVEAIRPLKNEAALAKRLFTEAEYAAYAASDDKASLFFSLWTAKEAIIKYTGEGFARPMHTVLADLATGRAYLADTSGTYLCNFFHYDASDLTVCAATDATVPPTLSQIPLSCLLSGSGNTQP